jgi:Trk K+ transport system NAD-binding subunit
MYRSSRARPGGAAGRHFVVFGEGALAYRLTRHLVQDLGASVSVILPTPDGRYAALIRSRLPRMQVTVTARPDEWQFERVGGHRADAFALVSEDDAANVDAWLVLRAMWPSKRVVVRIDDQRLKERLEQFVTGDPDGMHAPAIHVLSPSAIMAPLMVAAALGEPRPLHVVGTDYFVGKPGRNDAGSETFERYLGLFGDIEDSPGKRHGITTELASRARRIWRRATIRFRQRRESKLVRTRDTAGGIELLPPADSQRTSLVLGRWVGRTRWPRRRRRRITSADLTSGVPRRQQRGPGLFAALKALPGGIWGWVAFVVAVSLVCTVVWTVIRAFTQGTDPWDAATWLSWTSMYEVAVRLLSGTEPNRTDTGSQVVDLFLAAMAATIVPVLTATVVTGFVLDRRTLTVGRGPARRMSSHVVIVGLGDLGDKVLVALRRQGIRVVGIDVDPNAPGVATAHRYNVPVVFGDARNEETMARAHAGRARAVLALAKSEAANIEAALTTLHLSNEAEKPRWRKGLALLPWVRAERELRVVANAESKSFSERLTDVLRDAGRRTEAKHLLHVASAQNASGMTYAMFAAAILGATPLDVVLQGTEVLVVAEVIVEPGSPLEYRSSATVAQRDDLRVLGFAHVDEQRFERFPSPDERLWAGRRLVVIGTTEAVAGLAHDGSARRWT